MAAIRTPLTLPHDHAACHAAWVEGKLHLEIDPDCEVFKLLLQLAAGAEPAQTFTSMARSRLGGPNGAFRFDPMTRIANFRGVEVPFSRTEAVLVEILWRADGDIVPYSRLLSGAWGYIDSFHGGELVRAHLRNIRHKFMTAGLPSTLIQTVRGHGARIAIPDEAPARDVDRAG